ncbi:MAG: outer membrane beta-barrel protein [Gemmatimonadota bacterium]
MSVRKQILGAVILSLALVVPASAQDKAVSIAVRGGGFNSVADLNEAGSADFNKTGYNAGATVGVDLTRTIALRGDFTFARNELRQNGVETGRDLNRFFYDAGVQFQYNANGLKPYVFVGAGAVTLHPVGTSNDDQTKFAGTGGLGVNYNLPGTQLGLLLEGKGWVYELSGLSGNLSSFDKTQFDVTWSAGLSYRIPFASSAVKAAR